MTNRGKLVLSILITLTVSFGIYRWWDKVGPRIDLKIKPPVQDHSEPIYRFGVQWQGTKDIDTWYPLKPNLPCTNVEMGLRDDGIMVWRPK